MEAPRPFGPDTSEGAEEWAELGVLAQSDPDLAWSRLLTVAAETDEAGLFWVADIIEDLILYHGQDVTPRLDAELRSNAPLRRAFVSVVPDNPDPELEDRLLALRDEIESGSG